MTGASLSHAKIVLNLFRIFDAAVDADNCAVFVENGDGDRDAALAEAEGMVDQIGSWLAHDAFQDLPTFTTVLFGDSVQWLMDRTEYGAAVLVQFSVAFKARIYP